MWLALMGMPAAQAAPLASLANIEGIRENQLIGYGLIVGLDGSGDGQQIKFTGQSVANTLKKFGVSVPEGVSLRSRNAAAVMLSAELPPGYRRGQRIDVTVSSVGDAKSLRGGTLLLAPLRAADGEVYALAQGNVVVPGVAAQGRSGSSVRINSSSAGRIPQGATVEREVETDFDRQSTIRLNLKRPNFQTNSNIVEAINRQFGRATASSKDATSIVVNAPMEPTRRVAFMARLNALEVRVGQESPRAVFNSRTGTVVISQGMTVSPAAVSHGALKVVISERFNVSQPNMGIGGGARTVVTPESDVQVDRDGGKMFQWPAGAQLQDIVTTLNAIGAQPDDVMAILQALDQAGALNGELLVI
ncbi:flagellar basal body P-ring protein FlgI [Chromobacterium haemolyticum]|uniref:flagellar basal body P-ring protein FlgI n=1 Tax=Chromobacterium haemolyticum TaxID=394935 RepID=UPI0020CB4A91|nr:flagellar basal body P-ring protein FlgI [Chromobacterium haemolyticum]